MSAADSEPFHPSPDVPAQESAAAPTSSAARPSAADEHGQREQRASRLKERIYITFTALAVVLTLASHSSVTAAEAVTTLVVTVIGSVLAMFLAEILAHFVTHERMFTAAEARHAAATSTGATSAITVPLIALLLAWIGVWAVSDALRVSVIVLIIWLVGIGFLAVRKLPLPSWQRFTILAAEAGLGLVVVLLELMAHH